MKIAKKVLAVAMAVAMIACFAAIAFAAPADAKVALTTSEVVDGQFTAVLSLQNCLDLTAGDIVLAYDETALEFVPFNAKVDSMQAETLDDAKAFTNAGNTFSGMGNAKEVAGQVKFGFNFLEFLDAETFGVDVDMADVKIFRITFKVLDTTKNAELTLTGNCDFTDGSKLEVNEKITVATAAPEETTAVPEETTTAAADETTTAAAADETTTCCSPAETTTNKTVGPDTGDTGVLAIAAGVVALAGAAFVVSKKRK